MPVGLRNNRQLVTGSFERPADDGCAKGRMVNIGIAGEEDDIQLVPSTDDLPYADGESRRVPLPSW